MDTLSTLFIELCLSAARSRRPFRCAQKVMLGQLEMFHRQHQGHKSAVQKALDEDAALPPRVKKLFKKKEEKAAEHDIVTCMSHVRLAMCNKPKSLGGKPPEHNRQ